MAFHFNSKPKIQYRQKGVTLMELVIVMVVISTVSGVAAMKYGSSSSLTISQQSQMFANHVRQIQAMAFNWGCNLKLVVTTNGYSAKASADYSATDKATLCEDGVTLIKNPGRAEDFSYSLEHGVTFSGTGTLYIDKKGQPTDIGGVAISTNTDFQMTENSNNWQIRISPVSGFVAINKL